MASDTMPPVTAQNVLTLSEEQIVSLISATHVPDDENFDADSLFVAIKNNLKRAIHIVDNVLPDREDQEDPKNVEEEVCRIRLDPVLVTLLKELRSEMACKAPGVEIAHKITMSILHKLSSYSWDAKAVLTLAAFVVDYMEFSTLAQLHSSDGLVETTEIPQPVPATLKHLNLQKYEKTIGKLNKIISDTLEIMESIFELKKLSTNNDMKDDPTSLSYVVGRITVGVYWVIITVVACTTQISCLTSDEVKTQDLSPLAEKISSAKMSIDICHGEIEEKKERRKLKKHLQTPDEITEVFKRLVFAKDDMQPLIDGSTNEMVSIDILKKKNVLLFISSLNISNHNISLLMPIYNGIVEKGDQYKIVWIPIVEQWTNDLQIKFEMLRSKMPWYIVQYFSPVAGIKFIKEEWHFENGPIVVVMDPQGDVENEDALYLIRLRGMKGFPFTRFERTPYALLINPPGPDTIEEYTFLCGGKDSKWIKQFSQKVIVLAEDPVIKEAYISIKLSCIEKEHGFFWKLTETQKKKTESKPRNEKIQKLLLSFKNKSSWAVLTKWSMRVISDHGMTILKVLEEFREWKVNVPEKGFEICFKEYHDKFLQTNV